MSIVLNGNTYDITDFVGSDGLGYSKTFAATGLALFPNSIFTDMLAAIASATSVQGVSPGAANGMLVSNGTAWVRSTAINGCTVGATTPAAGAFTTLSASGDFAVATTKFTVEAATGNTVVAGTLTARGNTFIGGSSADGLFVVPQSAGGGALVSGVNTGGTDYEPLLLGGEYIAFQYRSGAAALTEGMRLTSTGLGIGTTSPSAKLHVATTATDDPLRIDNQFAGEEGFLALTAGVATIGRLYRPNATNNLRIDSYDSIVMGVNAGVSVAEVARFTSTGLGIAGSALSTSATGGMGYATGAGGAVTQATDRTTGVTLNKVCGAITLVSAAGSTTPASFTVTNSTVAATDTVYVSQKSGTDLYEIHVTAVAAGSFVITFWTTGGTTTEQPVFNFAVLKAVAA